MNLSKGFTLVELLVSIGIFVFMTVLLMTKYGNFNQSVLLTDLAYDVAITLRTAQTYGLSVVSTNKATDLSPFKYAYGVDFVTGSEAAGNNNGNTNQQLVLFADSSSQPSNKPNGYYDGLATDNKISTYAIKRGAVVSSLCAGTGPGVSCVSGTQLDVTFKRPDPSANICIVPISGGSASCGNAYAEITLKGTDGSTRVVSVRQNGQISVGN